MVHKIVSQSLSQADGWVEKIIETPDVVIQYILGNPIQ